MNFKNSIKLRLKRCELCHGLGHMLAMQTWPSYLASLGLHDTIYKIRMLVSARQKHCDG